MAFCAGLRYHKGMTLLIRSIKFFAACSCLLAVLGCSEPQYEGRPLRQWVALAKEGPLESRGEAIKALGKMGKYTNAVMPPLRSLLRDPEENVRRQTVRALFDVRGESQAVLSIYTELLQDDDPVVRRLAAIGLARLGPEAKPAVPALTELLQDEDKDVRLTAASALKKITFQFPTRVGRGRAAREAPAGGD